MKVKKGPVKYMGSQFNQLDIKGNNVLYMMVTADKLELPLAVGTPAEIAKVCGLSKSTIYTRASKRYSGKYNGYKIVKVEI